MERLRNSKDCISGKAEVIISLLLACCISVSCASDCETVYARLGDSFRSLDGASCGSSPSNPCPTITAALANADSGASSDCTNVELLASKYEQPLECETLSNMKGVIINGENAGNLPMAGLLCPQLPENQTAWLSLWNCSDILLQSMSVSLTNFTGWTALSANLSYNVSVQKSSFSHLAINKSAVWITDCLQVSVLDCYFTGPPVPDPFAVIRTKQQIPLYRMTAISVSQLGTLGPMCDSGLNITNTDDTPPCSENIPEQSRLVESYNYSFLVENTEFSYLGIRPVSTIYYTTTARYEDGVGVIIGATAAAGFHAVVRNCSFTNTSSPYDTALKLYSEGLGSTASFHVEGCSFINCWSYVGGAAFFRVAHNIKNASLFVSRSVFRDNSAYVDGGALAVSFEELPAGETSVPRLSGDSFRYISIKECVFVNNSVGQHSKIAAGGAIVTLFNGTASKLLDFSEHIPSIDIMDCLFQKNSAPFASTMLASKVRVKISNLMVRDGSGDSAFSFTNALLQIGDNVSFVNNTADEQGGAIGLYDYALMRVDENAHVHFINNSATYRGGAIYADESSSTLDIVDAVQYKTAVGLSKPCFLQTAADFSYSFNSTNNGTASMVFEGNTAYNGLALFANSFTACLSDSSKFLNNLHGKVAQSGQARSAKFFSGGVWMTLESVGCDCLKTIPSSTGKHWLLHRGCSHEQIYREANTNSIFKAFNYSGQYQKYLHGTRDFFENTVDTSGYGVFPMPSTFVMPWSVSTVEWYNPRDLVSEVAGTLAHPVSPSLDWTYTPSIMLYPAPGEIFPLNIRFKDIYVNEIFELAKIWVNSGDALLMHDQMINALSEPVLFCSSTVPRIGLAGKPGSQGTLKVTAKGQLSSILLQLTIPFRLQPCHFGFKEPRAMQVNTTEEIRRYMQGHPTVSVNGNPRGEWEQLVCQCPKDDKVAGVESCINGSDVLMTWTYWAGSNETGDGLLNNDTVEVIPDLKVYEDRLRSRKFLTSECYGGFCSDHNMQPWLLRGDGPCTDKRKGAICGMCAGNYSRGISWNPTCLDCHDSDFLVGKLYFLITFAYAAVALFLFSYFQIGLSAVFDSWVSFEQILLFISRRDVIMNTAMNYASYSCISKGASVMASWASLYLFFLSFYIWLFLVFQFSKLVVVRRFVLNHSLVVGLWASLTFSYAYILYPSFSLLACHTFDGRQVLYGDASVTCFNSEHLPWGVLALAILLLIAVPMPVVLLLMRSHPRVKPLADVYLSYVKDDRYWYIAYSLGRRIAVCVLAVYLADSTVRQIALAVVMQLFFFLHFIIMPYRQSVDNLWEAVFLGFTCVFAILSIVPMPNKSLPLQLAFCAYIIPVAAAFIYGGFRQRKKLLTLVEYILTIILFPVLVVYHRVKEQKFKRITFSTVSADIKGNEEPLMQGSEAAVERAREMYELRDDIMLEAFKQT